MKNGVAEEMKYEFTYIILADYTTFLSWNRRSFPQTKKNAVGLVWGEGEIQYIFIYTTTWKTIKCKETELEDVKKIKNISISG